MADHNAGLVSDAGIAIGCGSRDLLMTDTDVPELSGTAESIKHSYDCMSAKAEDILYASALQIINNLIGD